MRNISWKHMHDISWKQMQHMRNMLESRRLLVTSQSTFLVQRYYKVSASSDLLCCKKLDINLFAKIFRCLIPALQIFLGRGFPPVALPSLSSTGRCPSSGPSRWPAGSQKSPPHLFAPCCQVPPSNPWVLSLQVLQGVQLPLFYKHSTGLSHPAIWKL